jgi:hypothetical protein
MIMEAVNISAVADKIGPIVSDQIRKDVAEGKIPPAQVEVAIRVYSEAATEEVVRQMSPPFWKSPYVIGPLIAIILGYVLRKWFGIY